VFARSKRGYRGMFFTEKVIDLRVSFQIFETLECVEDDNYSKKVNLEDDQR